MKLKLALPKGSLEAATINIFKKAGFNVIITGRSYFPSIDDEEISIGLLRAQDISRFVEEGVFDCGITGSDWTKENNSKVIRKVLEILNTHNYVGSCTEVENGRGHVLAINLLGTINKVGVIKPRFNVQKDNYEKFEKRYLPAKDFGILIVSTSKGMMTHTDAKALGIGGRLVAYCY